MKKLGNPLVQFFSCFLRPKKKTPRSRVAPESKEIDLPAVPTNIDEDKSDSEYIAEKSPNPIHSTSIEEMLTIDEFVETAAALSKCVSTCLEHKYLLPQNARTGKPCLILDLDETLVHSSFKKPSLAFDFTVEMKVSPYRAELVYVAKRPGVDAFLQQLSLYYELVVFTASLPNLDSTRTLVSHRLFRDSCVFYRGYYIKNLESLGRSLTETIIVDNSPFSYLLQPSNAVAIPSWYSDPEDVYLLHILKPLIDISKLDNPVNALHLVNSLILNPLPHT